jgi:hypothetical protein
MDLTVSTLNVIGTITGAGLQSYLLEDQRFSFLIHGFLQEAIKG